MKRFRRNQSYSKAYRLPSRVDIFQYISENSVAEYTCGPVTPQDVTYIYDRKNGVPSNYKKIGSFQIKYKEIKE